MFSIFALYNTYKQISMDMASNDNKQLTVNEAAKVAGVTSQTVKNWIRGGKLAATKVRRGLAYTYSIDRRELDILLHPNFL